MGIVENIREIGMFIVVAQMLVHLSAGKAYEKYMKVIAGVIVLMLFIRPFIRDPSGVMDGWQEEIRRMEQQLDRYDSVQQNATYAANGTEETALRQIEEEVKAMLNDAVSDEGCAVTGVEISLENMNGNGKAVSDAGSPEWALRRVTVTVQETTEDGQEEKKEENTEKIRIEKITLESGPDQEADGADGRKISETAGEKYRQLFAQILGVAQDKVEVTYHGGR